MTVQNQSDNSTGPGSSFRRIDELCDEFEAAWNSGVPRTISSFLVGMEGDDRIPLLRELLHTELAHRESPRPTLDPLGAGLEEVQNLFESMVAIDPDKRFQSAAELVVAIEPCLRLLRTQLAEQQRGESTTVNTTDPGEDSALAKVVTELEVKLVSASTEDPAAGQKPRRLIAGLSILITLALLWLFFANQ